MPGSRVFIRCVLQCALACAAVWSHASGETPVPEAADGFLTPPKVEEIAAFANDVTLPRNFKGLAITVDREKVMEFFTRGEVKRVDADRARWRLLADFTLPDAVTANSGLDAVRKEAAGSPNGRVLANACVRACGVVATKAGTIEFWHLWNERVLELDDEQGRACLLVLGENAKPFAAAVHRFSDYPGADTPASLYGKLSPLPMTKDIVAFANRPDSSPEEGRRSFLTREAADDFMVSYEATPYGGLLAQFGSNMDPLLHPADPAQVKGWYQPPMPELAESLKSLKGDADALCDGALVTRDGRVIFWRLGVNRVFFFMDEQHRTNCAQANGKGFAIDRVNCAFEQSPDGMGRDRFSLLTYDEIAKAMPGKWNPRDPSPLSREQAVRAAWEKLQPIAPEYRDAAAWRVAQVAMSRLPEAGEQRWYYTVYFVKQDGVTKAPPVLVAMDGTACGFYAMSDAVGKMGESTNHANAEIARQQRAQPGWGAGPAWQFNPAVAGGMD